MCKAELLGVELTSDCKNELRPSEDISCEGGELNILMQEDSVKFSCVV